MFDQIFIEETVKDHERTKKILNYFQTKKPIYIDSIDNYFGKTKKPYLQKRTNLNIYIGSKKGQLVKPAPEAYGVTNEPHYYFIHAYNCIYECSYCYLQGYFDSPDLVFFINHEDIQKEIYTIAQTQSNAWFHAGEFSDSLALSHVTQEWEGYYELFSKLDNCKLELRTKSNNIKSLLGIKPLPNVFISYSLSPSNATRDYDLKTPSLKLRLQAMKQLADRGHSLGIHLDPMIYSPNFKLLYEELVQELFKLLKPENIQYISLGTVRFTKDVYRDRKSVV